jgi:hypothetical protein
MNTLAKRFSAKHTRPEYGCWIWTATTNGRYGLISSGGKTLKAHRVAYELYRGSIPEGMVVMHECDNPLCVNPFHLSIGTQLDNIRDRDRKGRQVPNHPAGEENGMRKLSDVDVLSIRRLRSSGWRMQAIAERFDVSRTTISFILSGKRWAHL